jgi:hypothetical protein
VEKRGDRADQGIRRERNRRLWSIGQHVRSSVADLFPFRPTQPARCRISTATSVTGRVRRSRRKKFMPAPNGSVCSWWRRQARGFARGRVAVRSSTSLAIRERSDFTT